MAVQITEVSIPKTGFLREPQVLAVFPVGRTTWWEGVRTGEYPPGYKLSRRCTAWRAEDIHALIKRLSQKSDEAEEGDDQTDDGGEEDDEN